MLKIRYGAFETNSSSTHSLIMCSESEFELLEDELMLIDCDKLISRHDAIQELVREYPEYSLEMLNSMSKEQVNALLSENLDYITFDKYINDNDLDIFIENYTTDHGDKVYAFGQYGFDG